MGGGGLGGGRKYLSTASESLISPPYDYGIFWRVTIGITEVITICITGPFLYNKNHDFKFNKINKNQEVPVISPLLGDAPISY